MPGGYLYQLFRPEFVRKYKRALCSDAYLKMLVDRSLNADISEASKHLKYKLIPSYAGILDKVPCTLPLRIMVLFIHQQGINVRYLRLLACAVKRPDRRRQINTEIVARVAKNLVRRWMRSIESANSVEYLVKIADVFNRLFSTSFLRLVSSTDICTHHHTLFLLLLQVKQRTRTCSGNKSFKWRLIIGLRRRMKNIIRR
jgi:hypothetical protein